MMPSTRQRSSRTTTRVEKTTVGGESSESKGVDRTMVQTSKRYEISSSEGGGKRYEMSSSSGGGSGAATTHISISAASGGASGGTARTSTTHHTSSSSRRHRSRSPLSVTREEEKDELAGLNDRLAYYIDYVRQLGLLNEDLSKKYKSLSKVETVDIDSIKGMFEDEMAALRRALDEMAKERAELEVENRKMRAEWDDMKTKLSRKEMEIRGLERKLEQLERELAESRVSTERYSSLKREFEQEMQHANEVKKALEKESVLRSEYEGKVNNLKMELEFLNNLHNEEKSKWMSRTIEIEEEVEDRSKTDYDSRLALELQLMREQTAEEMRAYKMEIENTFNTKFANLRATSDRSTGDIVRGREELYAVRKRYDEVNAELAKKQAEVESLMRRVGELERLLEQERGDFESQMRMYREENATLRSEMERRFNEFNELMAIKIQLDNEILAYRKLLECEELRCHLKGVEGRIVRTSATVVGSGHVDVDEDEEEMGSVELASTGAASISSADMRATYSVKSSHSGPVEINKCDVGCSVTLRNMSVEDCVIGGWQLRYDADGKETVYKFPRNLTLKSEDTCTIWSSESHTTHDPPHELVMKGLTFFTGNKIKIQLINKDDDELAECVMERDFSRRTATYSSHRISGSRARAGSEERCSVM